MKLSFARLVIAAVAGILMIKYREDMVTWLTILLGAMFFLSGIISVVYYFVMCNKRQKMLLEQGTGNTENVTMRKPALPIGGIGCAILGAILALMPSTFISYTVSIFAALIICGALGEYAALLVSNNNIRDYEDSTSTTTGIKCGVIYWIIPTLLLIFGIVAIVWPKSIASAPFLFLGIAMIVYAVGTLVNMLKLYSVKRRLHKMAQTAEQAVVAVEVTEEEPAE